MSRVWNVGELWWPCSVCLCSPSCEDSLFLSASLWYLLLELRERERWAERLSSFKFTFMPSLLQVISICQAPASTHSSLAVFRWVDCPCLLPRQRNEAFCDWVISGSTTVYLKKSDKSQKLGWTGHSLLFSKRECVCVVSPCLRRLLIFLNIVPWHSLLSLCWRINSSSSGFRRSFSSLERETYIKTPFTFQ